MGEVFQQEFCWGVIRDDSRAGMNKGENDLQGLVSMVNGLGLVCSFFLIKKNEKIPRPPEAC